MYQLSDPEVAMLVYLSTQGEARAILDQLDIAEMREEGGLQRVMRLLEESFGARSDERFEERQTAFHVFRRTPGMSISEYISTLKRLRNEYLREDPGTVLSDKSFAQRLLSRAGLTKRERMDVFFQRAADIRPMISKGSSASVAVKFTWMRSDRTTEAEETGMKTVEGPTTRRGPGSFPRGLIAASRTGPLATLPMWPATRSPRRRTSMMTMRRMIPIMRIWRWKP